MDKYKLCIKLLQAIQTSQALTEKEFNYITNKVANSFNEEHQLQPVDFKELNNLYITYKTQEDHTLGPIPQQSNANYLHSFIRTLSLFPALDKRKILADLFHMHVNRLFSDNPRIHKMIIYYLLIKEGQRL